MILSTQRDLLESVESLTVPAALGLPAKSRGDRYPHAPLQPVAAALRTLSEGYTGETPRGTPPALDRASVCAYMLYYLPINGAKVHRLLRSIDSAMPERAELSILDYGCGPGTAAIVTSLSLDVPIRAVCVDSNPAMREGASSLLSAAARSRKLSFSIHASAPSHGGPYDLIFACNVFNEVSCDERRDFTRFASDALAESGAVIILEPGTPRATRDLMALRDWALDAFPELSPLYPCTRRKPCPLLPAPSEWCHGEMPFERTPLIHQLDELTGFNKHRIKYASVIFGKHTALRSGFRVITDSQKSKRGSDAYLCGEEFAGMVQLSKRVRTDENRAFDKLKMHDRIVVQPPLENHLIAPGARVELVER